MSDKETRADRWIRELHRRDKGERWEAVHKLAKMMKEETEFVVPLLAVALEDKNAEMREFAARTLAKAGKRAAVVVPALVKVVAEDKNDGVRIAAMRALANVGRKAEAAVPAIGKVLESRHEFVSKDVEICKVARWALVRVGGDKAVEVLGKRVTEGSLLGSAREELVKGIGKIGGEKAVRVLVGVLKSDESKYVRLAAARSLRDMRAVGAVDVLIEVSKKDSSVRVRRNAVVALWGIHGINALGAIAEALGDRDYLVVADAEKVLLKLGLDALPDLYNAALKNPKLRSEVVKVISEITKNAKRPTGVRMVDKRPAEFGPVRKRLGR